MRFLPVFTLSVIGLCLAVSLVRTQFWTFTGELHDWDPIKLFGYRPDAVLSPNALLYAFVHAGPFHLIGNMLFLWSVAASLEDRWGARFFALFYVLGAAFSGFMFALLHLGSSTPLVGASGAIAACMGAFLVAYPSTRLKFFYVVWICLVPRAGTLFAHAYWVMPIWFALQLLGGYTELSGGGDGVAYSGHITGFLLGAAVGLGIRAFGLEQRLQEAQAAAEYESGWREDPEYVSALDALASGQRDAAIGTLLSVVSRLPRHLPSRQELTRLLIERRGPSDAELAAAPASEALEQLRHRDPQAAVQLYTQLVEALPRVQLTERALFSACKLASERCLLGPTVDAARRLMQQYPSSPAVPKVMWEAQQQQGLAGHVDAQQRTLENLVQAFPDNALAAEARQKLDQLRQTQPLIPGDFSLPPE